jgi:hypothetical protein
MPQTKCVDLHIGFFNFRGLRTPYSWRLCPQTPWRGWSLGAPLPDSRGGGDGRGEWKGEWEWDRGECEGRPVGRICSRGDTSNPHGTAEVRILKQIFLFSRVYTHD